MMLHVYIIHDHTSIYFGVGLRSSDGLVQRRNMAVSSLERDTFQRGTRDMGKSVTYLWSQRLGTTCILRRIWCHLHFHCYIFHCAFGCEWRILWTRYYYLVAEFHRNICKVYYHSLLVCFFGYVQFDVQILSRSSHSWVGDCFGAFSLLYFIDFSCLLSALVCNTRNRLVIYFRSFVEVLFSLFSDLLY